jgi:exodeoxyribonuclease V alpha subunit
VARETHHPRPERVRGRIDTVYFAKPQFSAGKLRTPEGHTVRFAGPFFAREGEQVVLCGTWEEHPRFGRQLKVGHIELDLPVDAEGLAQYLANHPGLKGIGPVKARHIAAAFAHDFERVLAEDPEAIAREAHLPLSAIEALRDEWQRTRALNAALIWLSSFGLTHHQVTTLVERFGNSAVTILREDPYLIHRAIKALGFRRLDKIARQIGTPKDHPSRLRLGLLHCVGEAVDQGHTYLTRDDLFREAHQLLVMDADDSDALIAGALQGLLAEGQLTRLVHGGRELIAPSHLLAMERQLHQWLAAAGEKEAPVSERGLAALIDHVGPELNAGQRQALRLALTSRISLIAGPAGSGKTRTIAAIVDAAEALELSVLLAAPTGKAAKRIEQVVGRDASTVHRLLGYDGESFAFDAEHPLEADLVVIDELSVVDVPLAWQLLQAIDLGRTSVVLVGDDNQLPPVGPGHPLRDLLQAHLVPTVVLDEVVRQAGPLEANSLAVLHGELCPTVAGQPGQRRPWYVVNGLQGPEEVIEFLAGLYPRLRELGFDPVEEVQLLVPMRTGPLGVHRLNAALQVLLQKLCWGVEVDADPKRRIQFLLHDRLIQTRNNYTLDVMNGALGTVTEVGPKPGELTVNFDGHEIHYEAGALELSDLSLAYVLTSHKAQGSEFPCVITLVHKSHAHMLHRNWLYTSVTRAQQCAIVVGDRWALHYAARERRQEDRRTLLPLFAAEGKPTE